MGKKEELLEAIAGKNRGLLANEADKVRILSLIGQLEDLNPTPHPLEARELLDGDWRLLYTTSRGILGIDQFPLGQLGQVYQCIRTKRAQVFNIAEVTGVPFLEGLVCVAASYEAIGDRRVSVKFNRAVLTLQRLIDYHSPGALVEKLQSEQKVLPLDFPIGDREQQGWLEVTYLDEDVRLSRGNDGNVFVLAKHKC